MVRLHAGEETHAGHDCETVGEAAMQFVMKEHMYTLDLYGPDGAMLNPEDPCPGDVYAGTLRPDIPPLTMEPRYVDAYLRSVTYGEDPSNPHVRQLMFRCFGDLFPSMERMPGASHVPLHVLRDRVHRGECIVRASMALHTPVVIGYARYNRITPCIQVPLRTVGDVVIPRTERCVGGLFPLGGQGASAFVVKLGQEVVYAGAARRGSTSEQVRAMLCTVTHHARAEREGGPLIDVRDVLRIDGFVGNVVPARSFVVEVLPRQCTVVMHTAHGVQYSCTLPAETRVAEVINLFKGEGCLAYTQPVAHLPCRAGVYVDRPLHHLYPAHTPLYHVCSGVMHVWIESFGAG